VKQSENGYPAVVIVTSEAGIAAPLGVLAALAADAIAGEFADSVAVVGVNAGDAARSPRVTWIPLDASPNPSIALEEIRLTLEDVGSRFAYTFVDASARGQAFVEAIIGALAERPIPGLANRLVLICESCRGPARLGWEVIRTGFLPPQPPPGAGGAPPPGMLSSMTTAAETLRQQVLRFVLPPERHETNPYKPGLLGPQWCRIQADLPAIARARSLPEARTNGFTPASIARWARAITQRRVGLVLGGSGAWGYAHVALMSSLLEYGVPIDLVGGASSGTLFGAYFCVLGAAGLPLAVARGYRFTATAYLSILSSAVLELMVALDLGFTDLEDLEVIFLPVTTNLTTLSTEIVCRAPVSFGVRASGSAPGFFGPTVSGTSVFVDGAVTDNVPAALVEQTGAALLVVANPLPSSTGVKPPTTFCQKLFATINPLARVESLVNSLSLLFHDVGEVDISGADTNCIFYDPDPIDAPLLGTFSFYRAQWILANVRAQPEFQRTIAQSVAAWNALRVPRTGVTSSTLGPRAAAIPGLQPSTMGPFAAPNPGLQGSAATEPRPT
jgi:NTE family protein